MEISQLIFIFLIGAFASFTGAMVGSAGLITIPFLIFLGVPPRTAIATNKIGAVGLKIGALSKFHKTKLIKWEYLLPFTTLSVLAALVGSYILLLIDQQLLTYIIAFILLFFLPFFLMDKNSGLASQTTSKAKRAFGYLLYFFVQVFSAFFGGGAGTIAIYVLITFFGLTLIEASATAVLPSMILAIVALVIFGWNGLLQFDVGIALFLGMLIGGRIGASTAIKKGNKWVRILFVITIIALAIKLLLG